MCNTAIFSGERESAVSPVVGVILMVAVTVILSAVIGSFVLDLTPSSSEQVQAGVSVSENTAGDYEVTVVSLDSADELRILSDGAEVATLTTAGETATVSGDLTVIGIKDGEESVITSRSAASESQLLAVNPGDYSSTSGYDGTFWSGYTFEVEQETAVSALYGGYLNGSTDTKFHMAIYTVSNRDALSGTVDSLVVSTEVSEERFGSNDISEVTLQPGQTYLVAQGAEVRDNGRHPTLNQIDTDTLVANEDRLSYWGPTDGKAFRWHTDGSPTVIVGTSADDTTGYRPHIGFEYIE